MGNSIPSFLLERPSGNSPRLGKEGLKISLIEKGIHRLGDVIKTAYIQWETASKDHFFQRIDARVKVLFLLFFVVIVSLKKEILPEVTIGAFILVLSLLARLNILDLYKRVLFCGFIFGFLIALPSAFNVITRGEILVPVLHLPRAYHFWIYEIPKEIGVTKAGLYGVMMLTLRVTNSVALSLLVLYTTPFTEIIKALKALRVPDSFLMIITLSYQYIFIFAKTVEEMHLAKKGRSMGSLTNAEARKWATGRIAFLFRKSSLKCEEVFKAMVSRGFSDTIRIAGVRKLSARDWVTGASFLIIGVIFILMDWK